MPSRSGEPSRASADALANPLGSLIQAAGVAVGVLAAYALLWKSRIDFLRAIDHASTLFTDFRFHFYPMAAQILEKAEPVDGYFYSAFFAILIHPLAWLSVDGAVHVWGWIQLLAFTGLGLIPLASMVRLSRRTLLIYVLIFMTSYPAISNFKWGQVSVLLTLLSIASFEASTRRHSILAGVLLAAAASIKYYSAIFFLFFLFRKDGRACLSFTAGGLLLFVAIPLFFLGPADWLSFHLAVMGGLGNTDWIAGNMNSQYFPHVVQRWAAGFSLAYGTPSPGVMLLSGLLALPNFALLFRIRRNASSEAASLSLILIFTALPFLVATSWPHYFVYLPFCQVATFTALNARLPAPGAARFAGIAPIALSVMFASLPFFLLFPVWSAYQEKGFLLLSNIALLPPIYVWALRLPAVEPEGSGSAGTRGHAPTQDKA